MPRLAERFAMLSTLLLIASLAVIQSEQALDPEVKALQGLWKATAEQNGHTIEIRKEISGYRETVRVTRAGMLEHEHAVEFELEETSGIRIFRWKNGLISAGPRQGQKLPDGAFVYRLKGDRWIGVFGVTDKENGPIYTEVFERVK
jgi:hypothetical protein